MRVSGLTRYQRTTYYFNPDRNDQLSYGLNVVGDKPICLEMLSKENAGHPVKDTHLKNGAFQLNIDPNGIVTVAHTIQPFTR